MHNLNVDLIVFVSSYDERFKIRFSYVSIIVLLTLHFINLFKKKKILFEISKKNEKKKNDHYVASDDNNDDDKNVKIS